MHLAPARDGCLFLDGLSLGHAKKPRLEIAQRNCTSHPSPSLGLQQRQEEASVFPTAR